MEYLNVENARSWIKAAALLISENAAMLTELDTAIGDGDHGENMMRGFKAIEKKLEASEPPTDLAALFKLVGMTLLSSVGGAAGPLYGGFFLALSKASAGKEKLSKQELGEVLSEGLADKWRHAVQNARVYAGLNIMQEGSLVRSTDGAATWVDLSASLPVRDPTTGGVVGNIALDPGRRRRLHLAVERRHPGAHRCVRQRGPRTDLVGGREPWPGRGRSGGLLFSAATRTLYAATSQGVIATRPAP